MRKHPLAECEKCPFEKAPFVPTQNLHPRSRLAVIGEAPGAYEAGRGIPFTGPSGRLLDQVLSHHGYHRDNVMVTNICLCRPANNDDPPKAAIAACKPRLDAELAQGGVEKILAVGGTSASTLIDPKKKISTLRVGPPKPYVENPEVSVVATWHPAYCLRSPDSFPTFVSDMSKLRGQSYAEWREPDYRVFTDPKQTSIALERLSELSPEIVIDIESGIEKDTSFDHPEQNELLCVGIAYAKGKVVVFEGEQFKIDWIRDLFGEYLRSRKITAHNGKFDLKGLHPTFGELELYADTMLMSYCLDERPGFHSLEKLGIELLRTPDWKSVISKYLDRKTSSYARIPRPVLYKYNAFDCSVTWDLKDLFLERMTEREIKEHNFLVKASNVIMQLEQAGISFDLDYSLDLQDQLERELDQLEVEISETTGRNLNPRSPMQITNWFADNKIRLTTTKAEVLEELQDKVSDGTIKKFIGQLLRHRRGTKLNGTYVKGFQNRIHNGKVYTTYTLHGTTSGRLASKNPNLQNIVRDKRVKHQFTVEKPGNVLIQADYKQAEGRVITTLAKDDYLAGIFSDSERDIFNELTEQIYGVGSWGKEERVKIKSVFYGLSYGRGAESIGKELDIPLVEARELLANFKALIPATVSWQASITHAVLSGEDLITPFGRKRSFWLITDQNRSDVINEALSFLPQSIASDICLTALIAVQPRLRGLATIRLTIHDALVLECKEENADEVVSIVKEEMMAAGRAFTDYVPFVVDVSMGKRWSDL